MFLCLIVSCLLTAQMNTKVFESMKHFANLFVLVHLFGDMRVKQTVN